LGLENLELLFPTGTLRAKDCLVYGNRRYFKRIIECLVQNSIEAESKERPLEIVIELKETDLYLSVNISDNGIGIEPSRLDLVTLSGISIGKESSSQSGSGLGLAFAFEKLEEWGGEAAIESRVNRGTRVQLNFLKVSL
jgi:signal transduction histidine kinase